MCTQVNHSFVRLVGNIITNRYYNDKLKFVDTFLASHYNAFIIIASSYTKLDNIYTNRNLIQILKEEYNL